ncbi:uncharacterized protein LOC143716165 [Siphateles boraxobius]|uniref:uncharacterized protein LOC143716165 n=1 Tax=Siphateles boraxobius TaxID=180520 RepID=UPI00406363F7
MKLGCDSDLPVWQVAVVVLSVGGEDLRRRSAVVSRTVELPVCAVLWDQMLAARAVCATRSQETSRASLPLLSTRRDLYNLPLIKWAAGFVLHTAMQPKLVHLSSTDCELAQLCGRVESVQLGVSQTA